jgi:hypothetical protein
VDTIHVVGGDGDNSRENALAEITPTQREAAETYVRHRLKHVPATTPALSVYQELAILRTATHLAAANGALDPSAQ